MKFGFLAAAGALALATAAPAPAQMNMPGMGTPMPAKPASPEAPRRKTDRQAGQTPTPDSQHPGHPMAMTGALGPYPMTRESSGTAWQPDTSEHAGVEVMSGDWTLMAHGVLNLVYDHQSGPRGDDKAFACGMLMGMAQRPLGNGTLQFKAMVSPDPLMGPSGYPLLLASGETANGRRPADRPPASARLLHGAVGLGLAEHRPEEQRLSLCRPAGRAGVRAAGLHAPRGDHGFARGADQPPLAGLHAHQLRRGRPAGLVLDRVKLEVSRFNGREPDQHRWNIETGPLEFDRRSAFVEPDANARAAGELGAFHRSRAARARVDQKRWSASALWADEVAPGWKLAGTLAWGRKSVPGHSDDAFAAEASLKHAELDAVRPRRDDRESRADRSSTTVRPIAVGQGFARRRSRFPNRRSLVIGRWRPCSRSTSCPMLLPRSTAATIRPVQWAFVRLKLD